jgi:hypothetical protein
MRKFGGERRHVGWANVAISFRAGCFDCFSSDAKSKRSPLFGVNRQAWHALTIFEFCKGFSAAERQR